MDLTEKTLAQKRVYSGKIINVRMDDVALPDGRPAKREVCEHPGGVGVLAVDGQGRVLLVRQFRYPYMEELLEIPAGKLSAGENPRACGLRELQEETGCTADMFDYLGCIYPSPGILNERIHLFYASGLRDGECCPDDDEYLKTERVELARFIAMIRSNEIKDAKTVAAFTLASCKYGLR